MRRKRLQHSADVLCQMFCGWRLLFSLPTVEQLGSGLLEVDVLARSCSFNGQSITRLSIVDELHAWLSQDLANHHIDLQSLREATIRVTLSQRVIHRSERKTGGIFMDPGEKPVEQDEYIACDILCTSRVATDEKVYSSQYRDLEEWPRRWRAGAA